MLSNEKRENSLTFFTKVKASIIYKIGLHLHSMIKSSSVKDASIRSYKIRDTIYRYFGRSAIIEINFFTLSLLNSFKMAELRFKT